MVLQCFFNKDVFEDKKVTKQEVFEDKKSDLIRGV